MPSEERNLQSFPEEERALKGEEKVPGARERGSEHGSTETHFEDVTIGPARRMEESLG